MVVAEREGREAAGNAGVAAAAAATGLRKVEVAMG